MSDSYPPEVQQFIDALKHIDGIYDVCFSIESIDSLSADDLRFAPFAHLPHAVLRRSGGGLPKEAFVQGEFFIERNDKGLRALEFVAWFVRDQARCSEKLQLRPFALPPVAVESVQLGTSLRFHLDLFCPDTGSDLTPVLKKVADIANNLNDFSTMYDQMLRERGAPGILA